MTWPLTPGSGVAQGPAIPEATQEEPAPAHLLSASSVTLDRQVHFLAPDGTDVVVEAGTYAVAIAENTGITLTQRGHPAIAVGASTVKHGETIEKPTALTVPDDNSDLVHVVLLLLEGRALDAVGSFSGTRPRGVNPALLSASQIQLAVQKQAPVVGVRGPTDFDLAYRYAPIHYQDTDSTNYRADYITRFDYDGKHDCHGQLGKSHQIPAGRPRLLFSCGNLHPLVHRLWIFSSPRLDRFQLRPGTRE